MTVHPRPNCSRHCMGLAFRRSRAGSWGSGSRRAVFASSWERPRAWFLASRRGQREESCIGGALSPLLRIMRTDWISAAVRARLRNVAGILADGGAPIAHIYADDTSAVASRRRRRVPIILSVGLATALIDTLRSPDLDVAIPKSSCFLVDGIPNDRNMVEDDCISDYATGLGAENR